MKTCRLIVAAVLVTSLAAPAAAAAPGRADSPAVITTIAGTGQSANNGDAGPATAINIGNPYGLEVGPDGALVICEVDNHRVRRLDLKTGRLTTIAGTGAKGHSGDGGPATKATLNEPYEVRFDRAGNMFFVEMRGAVVRRVDADTGVITTVAGNGKPGFSGDGGPATHAQLQTPHSIALDTRPALGKGRLYIADIGNHRIRRLDLNTGVIDTIAGTGAKQLPRDGGVVTGQPMLGPRALFVAGGTLWVALREGNSVWKIDLDTLVIHHVAGTGKKGYTGDGGPARDATFAGPKGVAVRSGASGAGAGADAIVYVADTENHAIRRIDTATGVITTIAGAGPNARGYNGDAAPPTRAHLNRPHGICAAPDGAVYISDSENHRVRCVR